jgi:hypothetical protein
MIVWYPGGKSEIEEAENIVSSYWVLVAVEQIASKCQEVMIMDVRLNEDEVVMLHRGLEIVKGLSLGYPRSRICD